jgi:hypothetical protein
MWQRLGDFSEHTNTKHFNRKQSLNHYSIVRGHSAALRLMAVSPSVSAPAFLRAAAGRGLIYYMMDMGTSMATSTSWTGSASVIDYLDNSA